MGNLPEKYKSLLDVALGIKPISSLRTQFDEGLGDETVWGLAVIEYMQEFHPQIGATLIVEDDDGPERIIGTIVDGQYNAVAE